MTWKTIGALPGGQLHPALNLALKDLELRLGELNGQIAAAEAQLAAMVSIDFDLDAIRANLEAFLDVDFALGVELEALNAKIALAATLNQDIRAVAAITARLSGNLGRLEAALGVAEIHAWSYDGSASKCSELFGGATPDGFGSILPGDEIRGAMFAGSSAANWATFSAAIATGWGGGDVATTDSRGLATGTLTYRGAIPGAALLLAAALALPAVSAQLEAIAALVAEITVNLGLLLTANIGIGLTAAASVALSGLASLVIPIPSIDIAAQLSIQLTLLLGLRLALEPIVLSLRATIAGSGIHLWAYEGTAARCGGEFASITSGGVAGGGPRDRVMALMLATNDVQGWDALNEVLRVY